MRNRYVIIAIILGCWPLGLGLILDSSQADVTTVFELPEREAKLRLNINSASEALEVLAGEDGITDLFAEQKEYFELLLEFDHNGDNDINLKDFAMFADAMKRHRQLKAKLTNCK